MTAVRHFSACRYACLCRRWSTRDRPRRRTRLTAGIGRISQPSCVSTPAAMNAATRTTNQMPTMGGTVLPSASRGIGCFPRKRSVSIEKCQGQPDTRLTCGNKISRSAPARHGEIHRPRRQPGRAGRCSVCGRSGVDLAILASKGDGVAWQSLPCCFDRQ